MRLDAETASSTYVENVAAADQALNKTFLEANQALREGIKAAQAGDRVVARNALLRASELDPQSESAWLWLASISEYPEELVVFLNNVLDINPSNARAVEWMAATKALLSKTFVQRGIDAIDSGQKELAVQYFDQALENDQKNTTAWLWLANLSDSNEGKISYLEKVLEYDAENQTARAAYEEAKRAINNMLLSEARAAAVSGRKTEAQELLDAFIAENPDSEDGWILRSHLADGFAEKIAAFEKVLAINPDNIVARSGLDSLQAIMQTVRTVEAEPEQAPEIADGMENTAHAVEQERTLENGVIHDKSPTQELVFPEAAFALAEREAAKTDSAPCDLGTKADEADPLQEMLAEESPAGPEWSMDTVAFSFSFPGGETAESEESVTQVENAFEFSATEADERHEASVSALDPMVEITEDAVVAEESYDLPNDEVFHSTSVHSYEFEALTPEVKQEPVDPASSEIDAASGAEPAGYETAFKIRERDDHEPIQISVCAYCGSENQGQAFTCCNCLSALTLADIEIVLANTHADKTLVRAAVENMEVERRQRPFTEPELTVLGIGYLNLREFQAGYDCLLEAAQLNPNNVVLAGQVNALHIRLEELKSQEAAHDAMPKGRSILVVDDSATVRKLIAGKLEKCGHEVYCAADGVEALEQLDSVIPDLILLDITMPRMDGYQVCKVIRSKDTTKDVPVVMISGKDGFFDKVRGRMAGTTGYITKPFGPETLMKAVETYLKGETAEPIQ